MKDFTITVAGQEAANGDEPFVYVASANDEARAESIALDWHVEDQQDATAHVVTSSEGVPPEGADIEWNDLREREINIMSSVKFECQGDAEATLIRNAVNLYRHVLVQRGTDPRNYAPANAEGAGFGWDAVQRTAREMSKGSTTYMSARMAEALRAAMLRKALGTPDRDAQLAANRVAERLAVCIGQAKAAN